MAQSNNLSQFTSTAPVIGDYYCVIAVRDSEKTISDVLSSMIQQSIQPKQIIVVNDGSTDNTEKILDYFAHQYPALFEIIHTTSKTRDYARIPKLWNLCLCKDYQYCMIGAGDCVFERRYAEKILSKMSSDESLVACSGCDGIIKNNIPRGAGRFVRQSFFFQHYNKYPEVVGYESELLERALILNYKIEVNDKARFDHRDKLGSGHKFIEFGMGMRSLGYYPPYAFGRFIKNFFTNHEMGKKGALQMLWAYMKFKPCRNGYYSSYPKDFQTQVRNRQKRLIKSLIRRNVTRFFKQ